MKKKRKLKKIRKKIVVKRRKSKTHQKLKKRLKTNRKSKKKKRKNIFSKKFQIDGFFKSIKPKLRFNLQGLLIKFTSPLFKAIKNYKKNRDRLNLKKKTGL